MATNIAGITTMIDAVMGVDPEPFCPTSERLVAKEMRDLAKQMRRIEDEMAKVLGVEPSPFLPAGEGCDIDRDRWLTLWELAADGIANVRSSTQGVIRTADEYLGVDPEPFKQARKSLEKIKRMATSLIHAIDAYDLPDNQLPPIPGRS